jgi:hypothetical protein
MKIMSSSNPEEARESATNALRRIAPELLTNTQAQ